MMPAAQKTSSAPRAAAPRRAKPAALLVEIGVEELPPRDLHNLGAAFAAGLVAELTAAGLVRAPTNYRYFAAPRRLAALIDAVESHQPPRVISRRGPTRAAAYDADGKPTAAAYGFAKSCGVPLAELATPEKNSDARLQFQQTLPGAALATILTEALQTTTRGLPSRKRMRWGRGTAEFVRPAHWLAVLHGRAVVAAEALGLTADRFTYGHRFHSGKLRLPNAEAYEELLWKRGRVIADYAQRRAEITRQITRLTRGGAARAVVDEALLDEVTGLVEWPQALRGEFDARFLQLPREVIVSVLHKHQKYFPVVDADDRLRPEFITVSNIDIPRGKKTSAVQAGNARVLRARLADAEFFLAEDLRQPLAARAEQLSGVLFQHKLGTLRDKTARIVRLANHIATEIDADSASVTRAAELCKADLTTELVGEFPELQGVVGRYYATENGAPAAVAAAIEQHYLPRFAGDQLPHTREAMSIAIADRVDSLLGIFAVGEIPSGDKDPFALRRAAAGILRIIIEKELALDLQALLKTSGEIYCAANSAVLPDAATTERVAAQVLHFVQERLTGYYQPLGYGAAEIAAVLAVQPPTLLDLHRRLTALHDFLREQPAAAATLAAAHKRITGILKRAAAPADCDARLFQHPAEHTLAQSLRDMEARARDDFARHRYADGLQKIATLKQPIDEFFENVMVLDPDAKIRANRLALLNGIRQLFFRVADISKLADGAPDSQQTNSAA